VSFWGVHRGSLHDRSGAARPTELGGLWRVQCQSTDALAVAAPPTPVYDAIVLTTASWLFFFPAAAVTLANTLDARAVMVETVSPASAVNPPASGMLAAGAVSVVWCEIPGGLARPCVRVALPGLAFAMLSASRDSRVSGSTEHRGASALIATVGRWTYDFEHSECCRGRPHPICARDDVSEPTGRGVWCLS